MKPMSFCAILSTLLYLTIPTIYGRSHCTSCTHSSSSCKQIPDRITQLKACLDAEFEETKMVIDKLELCEQSIPISQDDLVENVFTITASGTYCLVSDIEGRIVINTDKVVLDLNNHTISTTPLAPTPQRLIFIPGTLQNPRTHITIKNGTLRVLEPGTAAFINNNIGLLAMRCTGLTIKDVSFEGNGSLFTTGATIRGATGFFIDRCSFTGMGGVGAGGTALRLGLGIANNNGKISCCKVHNNFSGIIIEAASSNILLDTVAANDNAIDGLAIFNNVSNCSCINCTFDRNASCGYQGVATSRNLYFLNCQAHQNSIGFHWFGNNAVLDTCQASNNTVNGFRNDNATGSCVQHCIAKENGSDGFTVIGTTNYLFKNTAIANGDNGFNNAGNDNAFLSNYAEDNLGANYSNINPVNLFTISTGTFAMQPTAWNNIDVID